MKRYLLALLGLTCVAQGSLAMASDWPGWRGADGSGVSAETGLPDRWGASENIRWKADLPGRGVSSPVISRGRAYITACTGASQDRLHILCFDALSGKLLWERQLWATGLTQCHPKTSMAAPTPAADGERVYALFATCDLAAFQASGTILWYRSLARDYPNLSNQVGMAASPILWKDLVLLDLETDSESFALAIDKNTGLNRWKVHRNKDINWVTPLVARIGAADLLLLQCRRGLTAYDPETGEARWTHSGTLDVIPSPVVGNGRVYVPAGEIMALEPGSPESPPTVRWKSSKLHTSMASPIFHEGRIYAVNSAGVLSCADASNGEVLWQERVSGPFSASPVLGDGKIYFVNEEGLTTVVDIQRKERLISTNPLNEGILASPAISEGALFLRSDKHLFCIGKAAPN